MSRNGRPGSHQRSWRRWWVNPDEVSIWIQYSQFARNIKASHYSKAFHLHRVKSDCNLSTVCASVPLNLLVNILFFPFHFSNTSISSFSYSSWMVHFSFSSLLSSSFFFPSFLLLPPMPLSNQKCPIPGFFGAQIILLFTTVFICVAMHGFSSTSDYYHRKLVGKIQLL